MQHSGAHNTTPLLMRLSRLPRPSKPTSCRFWTESPDLRSPKTPPKPRTQGNPYRKPTESGVVLRLPLFLSAWGNLALPRNQETMMILLLNTAIYGFVVRTYTGYGLNRCVKGSSKAFLAHVDPADVFRWDSKLGSVIAQAATTWRLFAAIEVDTDCSVDNLGGKESDLQILETISLIEPHPSGVSAFTFDQDQASKFTGYDIHQDFICPMRHNAVSVQWSNDNTAGVGKHAKPIGSSTYRMAERKPSLAVFPSVSTDHITHCCLRLRLRLDHEYITGHTSGFSRSSVQGQGSVASCCEFSVRRCKAGISSRLKMPKASILQDTLTGNFCLISTC